MSRVLVVLGTSSQAPTRDRNHNGYLLLWDDLGILFDPGEGTQRQMLFAGVKSSQISHIVLTHEHGDHTLGVPGVLQRMVLDQRQEAVVLVHPAPATAHVDRLLLLAQVKGRLDVQRHRLPTDRPSDITVGRGHTLTAIPLDHRVPALGYRLQEPDRRRMDPARLERAGLAGPIVGRLAREGQVRIGEQTVRLDQVSRNVPGQAFAFVMDTRPCPAIATLIDHCDLAVLESTYLDSDRGLADRYGHMTATQAGREAGQAGVRRVVLTHFSQRYEDPAAFVVQANAHHHDVVAATDLSRVDVPRRQV